MQIWLIDKITIRLNRIVKSLQGWNSYNEWKTLRAFIRTLKFKVGNYKIIINYRKLKSSVFWM